VTLRRRRGHVREGPSEQQGYYIAYFSALMSSFLHRDEEGQDLADYGLILALIATVTIIALIFMGGEVKTILSTVGKSV